MLETTISPDASPITFISSPTPVLRALVLHYRSSMSVEDFEGVLSDIRRFFDKATVQLLAARPGADRADLLHQMMDHELKAASTMNVSCRKGCGGCCHYEVEITQEEGALLAELVANGQKIDRSRLEVQASYERQSPEWAKFWSPQNRCVFLGDQGACQIYEDRPSICRKHSVVTPAESCTTLGQQVTPVQIPLAEILLSAALSIPGSKHASLSKMLIAELDKETTDTLAAEIPTISLELPLPVIV